MDLFAKNLEKPGPIPKDIFKMVGYENNLNWMIMSSQGTGNKLKHVNAEHVQKYSSSGSEKIRANFYTLYSR